MVVPKAFFFFEVWERWNVGNVSPHFGELKKIELSQNLFWTVIALFVDALFVENCL